MVERDAEVGLDPAWPAEWLRGTLTLGVLGALAHGPSYGYAIATALEGVGMGVVKGGTLYPLLTRLERDGLVASTWQPGDGGPGRKYFELTEAGHRYRNEMGERWTSFSTVVTAALTGRT